MLDRHTRDELCNRDEQHARFVVRRAGDLHPDGADRRLELHRLADGYRRREKRRWAFRGGSRGEALGATRVAPLRLKITPAS
jgi:hypothetical protein